MTVLLLDGYNLLFRSFSSLPPAITAGDGQPINAVYGMLAFILRLAREEQPDHIVAAFDEPEVPTFRHRLYPRYQAQRGPLGGENAVDFQRQVSIARDILPHLGIPSVSVPGFEADDVMGTLAMRVADGGGRAVMVSTDRDLLQLVRPGIEILVPGKELLRIRDEAGVRSRFGVGPKGVTTLKALAGDASDNIPGLRGIGVKTAAGLVDRFGTLEQIYAHLDALPARTAGVLAAGREDALLFRNVATIHTDLETGLPPFPGLQLDPEDRPRGILDRHLNGQKVEPDSG